MNHVYSDTSVALFDGAQDAIKSDWTCSPGGSPTFSLIVDDGTEKKIVVRMFGRDIAETVLHALESSVKDYIVSRQTPGDYTQPVIDQMVADDERTLKYADEHAQWPGVV